jgi:hypothetical protein
MSDHFNLGDDTFLAPAADLARILAQLAYTSNRGAQLRTKHVAVSAIPTDARAAIPERWSTPPKTDAAVVSTTRPVYPEHPRRERLRSEMMALLQSRPVIGIGRQAEENLGVSAG